MMKEEKQETGLDSGVLVQKAELLPLKGKRKARPDRLDSKRKPKSKKAGHSAENTSFIGQIIHGVVDGSFDAGYLLTVRVGDTDTLLRGVVFEPGLSVPISEVNDVAPNVKLTKRDTNVPFCEALHTSNTMPHGQHSHITMLPAPVPIGVAPSCFLTPEKIGSDRIDMGCHQQDATPSQSASTISENISRLPSSVSVANPLATSFLSVQNHMEPPASKGSYQTYVGNPQINAGPSTTSFILKTNSKLPSAVVSKSVNLQSQINFPAVISSGKTDIVLPHPGAIPAKSTSCSVPVHITNTVATSSAPVETGMRLPATITFGQTDLLTLPDQTTSKSTSISEVASGFPSSMLKMDASAASSIHVQYQMGRPVSIGSTSCQTDMATTQLDTVLLESACTSIGVPIPSSMPDANVQPISSAHAEKTKPPTVTGSSQTDKMLLQEDTLPSMSSFVSQAVSSLPSPMLAPDNQVEPPMTISCGQPNVVCSQPDAIPSKSISLSIVRDTLVSPIPMLFQHTQATSSVCVQDHMEFPAITESSQTGMVLPQLDVIPTQSTSTSQTVSTMRGPMYLPTAPSPSSVAIQKQIDSHVGCASGQTYSVACQPDTIPTISASVSQTLPMLSASMPIQYAHGGSILVQNQKGPSVRTVSGQTDIVVPLSDLNSLKTLSVPENSTHSEHGHSGPSEQVCESMKVTEIEMDRTKAHKQYMGSM